MKVSICIPTYNKPAELKRLLTSIETQSFRDYEIIISDDSNDSAPAREVIRQFASLPIKYFFHDPAFEPAQNWNFLLDQAKGEYVKIIHDDDWLPSSDALQIFVNKIESSDTDFVWSSSVNYKQGNVVLEHYTSADEICNLQKDSFVLFLGNFVGNPSTTMVRNTVVRYDERLKWFVDIEYYIRILQTAKCAYIDLPLVGVSNDLGRLTDECITNNHVIYSEFFYCFEKYRSNGILSFWKSYYWLYKFFRLHRPTSWNEIEPYCEKYKTWSYVIYQVFKIKLKIDLWKVDK